MKAGLLVRISEDRDDVRAGVGRQEADGRALAERRGDDVVEVYVENDTSAFKRRTVTLPDGSRGRRVIRPEYRRALADLQAGTIDVLICYDLDRMVRDPRDLEDLIDVCEQTGRTAISVTGSLQLDNNAGITMARVGVAMANQSSRDTGRRVSRARAAAAAEGRWTGGGRRPYGLTADRKALVPEEARVLTEAAAAVLAGHSLNSICRDLNDRGVTTASGSTWQGVHLRSALTKPAVAGLLVYRGEVVGDAPWPAILERGTWEQVCLELSSRTPRSSNQLRFWLSGILLCSKCNAPLRGNGDYYWCGNGYNAATGSRGCGGTRIKADLTEEAIATLLLRRTPGLRVSSDDGVKQVPEQAAQDDEQLAELAEMWGAREITLAEYRAARAKILERAARPRPATTVPSWARSLTAESWEELTAAAKRRIASALLEGVVVLPAPTRRWTVDRLEVHWR